MPDTKPVVRTFNTGATRDLDESKFDYEGFFSPYVMDAFAAYMHSKRPMADGSLRDSDNWQKGMPLDSYMKSGFRHFMDWWAGHRGNGHVAKEPLETALCALLFNVQGYLHEIVKARVEGGTIAVNVAGKTVHIVKEDQYAKYRAPTQSPEITPEPTQVDDNGPHF